MSLFVTATVRAYGCLMRCDSNRTVSRSNPARVWRRCRHQPRPDPGCTPRFSIARPDNVLARDRSRSPVIASGTYTQSEDAPEGKRAIDVSLEPQQAVADIVSQLDAALDDRFGEPRAGNMRLHWDGLMKSIRDANRKKGVVSYQQGKMG